jgi:hypothetical protein
MKLCDLTAAMERYTNYCTSGKGSNAWQDYKIDVFVILMVEIHSDVEAPPAFVEYWAKVAAGASDFFNPVTGNRKVDRQ